MREASPARRAITACGRSSTLRAFRPGANGSSPPSVERAEVGAPPQLEPPVREGQARGHLGRLAPLLQRPGRLVRARGALQRQRGPGVEPARHRLRRGPRVGRHPTEPSIWSWMRRFISTAYSIGSSFTTGSMKPATIIAAASSLGTPRLVR